MTKAEIISSLLDQARDKDALANGEADSIFADDARALREAAELLKSVPEWVSVADRLPNDDAPARHTEADAYKAAMARWQEPNRVLTLEELQTYTGYAWHEGDHKWYHSSFDYPVWIEDGKYNYEGDLYDIPDEVTTGRFWLRKPTEEERENTPWEDKDEQ